MAFSNTAIASTLQRREKGYLDAISQYIVLFDYLRKKKQYKPFTGGVQGLEWNVEYGLDTSEPSFAGYDPLTVTPQDNVETAAATMKEYYKSISFSGAEKYLNKGERIFDLIAQKEDNALKSLQQQMNDHFYDDGTGNSSKRITGLKAIISASPTSGTLFGLARSTRSYWQNQRVDSNAAAFDLTNGVPKIVHDMRHLWVLCGRLQAGGTQNRFPDFLLCTEQYYEFYEQASRYIGQRIVNKDTADPAYMSLQFNGVPLVYDSDMPQDAGSGEQCYFLNSRFLTLWHHPELNFKMTDMTMNNNQHAFTGYVFWMGELTSSLPAKLGIHEGITVPA